MPEYSARIEKDLARHWLAILLWGPPLVAILASGLVDVAPVTRGAVWSLAFGWAGVACIANACRSGRLHCYITGPFFLLLAAASLLYGLGVAPLGLHGWLWIGAVCVVGTPLLTVVPERIWGRYSDRPEEHCC